MDNAPAVGAAGMIIDQDTFYAWLARADTGNLIVLDDAYAPRIAAGLEGVRVSTRDADGLARAVSAGAEPFHCDGHDGDVRVAGVVLPGHEEDESLRAPVLLENLAAKVTGALALRRLRDEVAPHEPVDFLLGSGEEAVGDRYQRGGGNLAKAIGELAGVRTPGGADVKAFCAGPVHALILAGALIAAGVHRRGAGRAGGGRWRGHARADAGVRACAWATRLLADGGAHPVGDPVPPARDSRTDRGDDDPRPVHRQRQPVPWSHDGDVGRSKRSPRTQCAVYAKGGDIVIDLKDKLVLALGDRDGVPVPALEPCAVSAGAQVIYSATQCFA